MKEFKLDPRTKLIIVFYLSTIAVLVKAPWLLGMLMLFSIAIALALGAKPNNLAKRIKGLIVLVIVIAIIQSIFMPGGRPLLTLFSINLLTIGGFQKGMELIFRLGIVIISASIIGSSSSREIVQGLIQWKIPYEIAFMVSIGIQFLPMLKEEMKDTLVAIQLRGIELEKIPIGKKLNIYAYLFTPVIVGVTIKAKKLAAAMETRAFRAYPHRTSYRVFHMNRADYANPSYLLEYGRGMTPIITPGSEISHRFL